MRIETGKYYLTRNGSYVKDIRLDYNAVDQYIGTLISRNDSTESQYLWHIYGSYHGDEYSFTHKWDIVEEITKEKFEQLTGKNAMTTERRIDQNTQAFKPIQPINTMFSLELPYGTKLIVPIELLQQLTQCKLVKNEYGCGPVDVKWDEVNIRISV